MEKKIRYFIATRTIGLEKEHPGYHLKRVRKVLNVKQSRAADKAEHCDSTTSDSDLYLLK